MDTIRIISINANFTNKTSEVKCELLSELNGFVVSKGNVTVPVNKVCSSISPELEHEIATTLSEAGFDIAIPELPTA